MLTLLPMSPGAGSCAGPELPDTVRPVARDPAMIAHSLIQPERALLGAEDFDGAAAVSGVWMALWRRGLLDGRLELTFLGHLVRMELLRLPAAAAPASLAAVG